MIHRFFVVNKGTWSDKYGRFVYPAFTDQDTHDDIALGVTNRWAATEYVAASLASRNNDAERSLREIANIAHHGGLIGYNTSAKAMDAIRDLSMRWWDRKECEHLQQQRRTKAPPNA